jgi:hypothetical protein
MRRVVTGARLVSDIIATLASPKMRRHPQLRLAVRRMNLEVTAAFSRNSVRKQWHVVDWMTKMMTKSLMRGFAIGGVVFALAGCVYQPAYEQSGYQQPVYQPPQSSYYGGGYYAPAPAYAYPPPRAYYGPSLSLGFGFGGGGGRHGEHWEGHHER